MAENKIKIVLCMFLVILIVMFIFTIASEINNKTNSLNSVDNNNVKYVLLSKLNEQDLKFIKEQDHENFHNVNGLNLIYIKKDLQDEHLEPKVLNFVKEPQNF